MANTILFKTPKGCPHIDFEELAALVFSDGKSDSFLRKAAIINKHVMECPQCFEMYQGLMLLRDRADQYAAIGSSAEKNLVRVFQFFFSKATGQTLEQILNECSRFKTWLSFSIKTSRDLLQASTPGFSNPRLVTLMKSLDGGKGVEETETTIRSSLFDKDKNRVCIGMDGTLSLYFDSSVYGAGKRVLVLPDDMDADPMMIELVRYDDAINYVRFEGIKPGKYTVMIESN